MASGEIEDLLRPVGEQRAVRVGNGRPLHLRQPEIFWPDPSARREHDPATDRVSTAPGHARPVMYLEHTPSLTAHAAHLGLVAPTGGVDEVLNQRRSGSRTGAGARSRSSTGSRAPLAWSWRRLVPPNQNLEPRQNRGAARRTAPRLCWWAVTDSNRGPAD